MARGCGESPGCIPRVHDQPRLPHDGSLDEGETESLALASSRRALVLMDEKEARALAAATGVEYMGTAGVMLEAFIKRKIRLDELETAVRDLGRVMWLSPDVIADILRKAREVRR